MFIKYLEHILDHQFSSAKPLTIPNHATKTCALAAVAFGLQASQVIDLGGNGLILFGLALIAITIRLFSLTSDFDPFDPLERAVCKLLFGTPQTIEGVKTAKKD